MSQTEQQIKSRAQFIRASFLRRHGSNSWIAKMLLLLDDAELVRRAAAHHAETLRLQSQRTERTRQAKSVMAVSR